MSATFEHDGECGSMPGIELAGLRFVPLVRRIQLHVPYQSARLG
jgi:hypothetical protein